MTLTLTVTSHQRQALGPSAVIVARGNSLSIGRSPSAGWHLPDPQGVLSREHARIERHGGEYVLTDLSQNGTFLNGSAEPISHGKSARLAAGDRILIGDYEIVVTLDPTAAPMAAGPLFPPPSPPPSPVPYSPPTPHPNYSPPSVPSNPWPNIGEHRETDPLKVMGWDDHRATHNPLPGGAGIKRSAADRQGGSRPSALSEHYAPPVVDPHIGDSHDESGPIPDRINFTQFERGDLPPARDKSVGPPDPPPGAYSPVTGPAQPPPSTSPYGQAYPSPAQAMAGPDLERILVAAGLDVELARAAARDLQLAEVMGQILQTVLTGLIEVLRARAHIKQQFRLNLTQISAQQNNPLKLSVDSNQALYSLFVKPATGFLSPVEAVDEAFNDIKAHQMAVLAGMRAAFDQMFARFDPDKLKERFDKSRGSGILPAMNKSRHWDDFVSWYAELAEDRERGFHRLFGEEFAKAYEQQMQRITPRGRRR